MNSHAVQQSIFYIASSTHQWIELTCIGGLIGGFILQTEELGTKHRSFSAEDVLEECTQLVACFRELKKGFEPLLFMLYSTNVVILTVYSYFFIEGIIKKTAFDIMLLQFNDMMIPIFQLIYTALLTDNCYSAMKDMLIVLR